MKLNEKLINLAKKFEEQGYSLYLVGGFVRDMLLDKQSADIDITSNMPYEKVIALCKKHKIKCTPINKNLGTLQIILDSNIHEYTVFRKESYSTLGKHTPEKIEFVDDIKIDVLRRDITINSLYLNILNKNIIDLCGGQKDLERGIIRTTNHPKITLKDDALRILRIIRFASRFNFKIEKETLKYLKRFSSYISQISKERILQELKEITTSDIVHNSQAKIFLQLFNRLKIYPYIFNSTLRDMPKITKKDMAKYYTLTLDARQIGFYILMLKTYIKGYIKNNQLQFVANCLLGQDGIKEKTSNITLTTKLYLIYQNLEYGIDSINATVNYLSLSNTEREIILLYLNKYSKQILFDNIKIIKDNNLPIGVHELPITPTDLIEAGIDQKYISKIMQTLFNQVLQMSVKNEREDLLKLAKDIDKTFSQIKDKEK